MTDRGNGSAATELPETSLEAVEAMKDNKPLSMAQILEHVAASEDMDACFILAGIVNLYINALKRTQARTHVGPQDMQSILRICRTMLTAVPYEHQFVQ